MLKSWQELGNVLADFESRLLTLENSQPYHHVDQSELIPLKEPANQGDIDQLKCDLISLRDFVKQHVNETRTIKKTKGGKFA